MKLKTFKLLDAQRKQQIRRILRILQTAKSSFEPGRSPYLCPRKNSPELYQSREQPLANVGWTCMRRPRTQL